MSNDETVAYLRRPIPDDDKPIESRRDRRQLKGINTMSGELRAAQDHAIAAASKRSNPPAYPGGAAARAADETKVANILRRRPDADLYRLQIRGHDMLGEVLAEVALAAREGDL